MKKFVVAMMLAFIAVWAVSCKDTKPIAKKAEKINIAKVNGIPISNEDLKNEFNMLSVQAQQMFVTTGGLEDLLQEIIKKEMLYQEAKKRNYATDKEFQKMMEDYRKRLMISFLLEEEVEKKSEVTDTEVRKFYDENRADFTIEAPDKGEPQTIDFEAVKHLIKMRLAEKKQAEVFESYIAKLKGSYKVDFDEEAFAKAFGNATSEAKPVETQPGPVLKP